ncbi:MAG TPA: twin-arginine translocase subunit TatC, partial [Streptosporangiaceae bacterium]
FFYKPIWSFLQAPYCRLHLHSSAQAIPLPGRATSAKSCPLYVTGIFDGLFMQVKVCIAVGVIGSAPLWMYQLWGFIAPGLHARERRWAYFFAGSAIPLFALGGTVAYFAMSKGLRFMLGILPGQVFPIITINNYLSYAMAMLLIFGLAFELPLVMILLNVAGILNHQRFAKWRRMIIFGVFAFAAVATPSPDPFSMLLLAVPCVILVEAAEIFVWANDRRKAKRGTVYPGLSPEQIHEYGLDDEPVLTNDLDAPH